MLSGRDDPRYRVRFRSLQREVAGRQVLTAEAAQWRLDLSAELSCASGQRVRKRHPDGGSIGLGSSPRMPTSVLAFSTAGSGTGIVLIRACGVGVGGALVDVLATPQLDQLAQVHHADPVSQILDHRQIV